MCACVLCVSMHGYCLCVYACVREERCVYRLSTCVCIRDCWIMCVCVIDMCVYILFARMGKCLRSPGVYVCVL